MIKLSSVTSMLVLTILFLILIKLTYNSGHFLFKSVNKRKHFFHLILDPIICKKRSEIPKVVIRTGLSISSNYYLRYLVVIVFACPSVLIITFGISWSLYCLSFGSNYYIWYHVVIVSPVLRF
jgi:hypothetical protein